jgi:hypothetical protein
MKTATAPRISPAKHRKRKQTSDHILRHGTPVEAPRPDRISARTPALAALCSGSVNEHLQYGKQNQHILYAK